MEEWGAVVTCRRQWSYSREGGLGGQRRVGAMGDLGGSCVSKRLHKNHRHNPLGTRAFEAHSGYLEGAKRPTWCSWGSGPGRKAAGPRQ